MNRIWLTRGLEMLQVQFTASGRPFDQRREQDRIDAAIEQMVWQPAARLDLFEPLAASLIAVASTQFEAAIRVAVGSLRVPTGDHSENLPLLGIDGWCEGKRVRLYLLDAGRICFTLALDEPEDEPATGSPHPHRASDPVVKLQRTQEIAQENAAELHAWRLRHALDRLDIKSYIQSDSGAWSVRIPLTHDHSEYGPSLHATITSPEPTDGPEIWEWVGTLMGHDQNGNTLDTEFRWTEHLGSGPLAGVDGIAQAVAELLPILRHGIGADTVTDTVTHTANAPADVHADSERAVDLDSAAARGEGGEPAQH